MTRAIFPSSETDTAISPLRAAATISGGSAAPHEAARSFSTPAASEVDATGHPAAIRFARPARTDPGPHSTARGATPERNRTVSTQRTGEQTCRFSAVARGRRVGVRGRVDVRDDRKGDGRKRRGVEERRQLLLRRLHQGAVKRRGDGERKDALGPPLLQDLRRLRDGSGRPRDDGLLRRVEVRGGAGLARRARGLGARRGHLLRGQAEHGRHGPLSRRDRFLHEEAAAPDENDRVLEATAPRPPRAPSTRRASGPPRRLAQARAPGAPPTPRWSASGSPAASPPSASARRRSLRTRPSVTERPSGARAASALS